MAKLILKQPKPPKGSWLSHYGSQLAYAGFIGLLLIISFGMVFAFKPHSTVMQALPTIDSAVEPQLKSQYLSDWEQLNEMQATYEQLAKEVSSEEHALALLNQAEIAWQHLLIMSESVAQLGLNASDKKQLEAEQAYLQDQWQARIHFSELRLERFKSQEQTADLPEKSAKVVSLNADNAASQPVVAGQPSNKYIAQPPADLKLPAGFCTLDSAGVCKPETSN
ncbi:hypothetical protein [Thiothrix eikelboomii]|uniref:hypothetical protein n=1 Tax=Thiothrix eikelboomii TaxID=92487 RepID=UPI003BAF28F2